MLVGMTFGLPRQSKKLESKARETEDAVKAQRGVVSASGFYFRKSEGGKHIDGLAKLKSFQNEWKGLIEHYARYPFASGMKILPAALVEQCHAINEEYKAKQAGVWQDWYENDYQLWWSSGVERMGTLFDEHDFPSEQDCFRRFKCAVTIVPLAEAEQWQRIAVISPNLAQTMASTQNEAVANATRSAHAKLWADIMEKIQHVVDTLEKDKTKIHTSLMGNVTGLLDLLPAYNDVLQDNHLTQLASEWKSRLGEVDAELLRSSAEARAQTIEQAKELVSSFTPYARAFELDEEE
jgi:hypothetical protein